MTDVSGPGGTPGPGAPSRDLAATGADLVPPGSPRRRRIGASEAVLPDAISMEELSMEAKLRKVEVAISLVLRIGVVVSVLVVTAGLGVMFAHHSAWTSISGHVSYRRLTTGSMPFPHSFSELGHYIALGKGRGIVVLGVLLLILTPVLRVAVGVLSFIYEKDPPMTIVTLYVLVVLVGSFFLAGV